MNKIEAVASVRKAKLALRTAENNLAFARMSRAKQRVAIAKDVIAQVKLGFITSKPGVYIDLETDKAGAVESCNTCALGSLMACVVQKDLIDFTGGLKAAACVSASGMHAVLAPYFDTDQLAAIENAHERTAISSDDRYGSTGWVTSPAVLRFNKGCVSDKDRLVRIMKNIIANGGEFCP